MKSHTNKILLAVFVLSLSVYIVLTLIYLDIIPVFYWRWPDWAVSSYVCLVMGFHVVPAFCFQLLLCRKTRRWVAAIPVLAAIGVVVWFAYSCFTSTGWDMLGWGILLILSIAPVVGCALAWGVYGLHQLYKRGDIRG